MATITKRKTKAELMEIIEEKERDIADLHKEIDKLEKYKQYEDAAGETKALFDSYVAAGFNEQQAMDVLLVMLGCGCSVKPARHKVSYRDYLE